MRKKTTKRKTEPTQADYASGKVPRPPGILGKTGIDWWYFVQFLAAALIVLGLVVFAWSNARAQTAALTSVDVEPPPAKYDHPYKGEIAIFHDLDPAGEMWAWTDPRGLNRGICNIHVVPNGTVDHGQIMDEDALTRVLRHENAHCNGWVHK